MASDLGLHGHLVQSTGSSRSVSVFDGSTCSSGTSSPVSGELEHLLAPHPGTPQHLHDRPRPERLILQTREVVPPTVAADGEQDQSPLAARTAQHPFTGAEDGGELLPGCRGLPSGERGGGLRVATGHVRDERGQQRQPFPSALIHPGLGALPVATLLRFVPGDRARRRPRPPPGRLPDRPSGQIQVEPAHRVQALDGIVPPRHGGAGGKSSSNQSVRVSTQNGQLDSSPS